MIHPTAHPIQAKLSLLLLQLRHDQAGNGALEYAMMLALLLLGTTTMLGNAANFFIGLLQNSVAAVGSAWPS